MFRAADWLEQRHNGLGKYEPQGHLLHLHQTRRSLHRSHQTLVMSRLFAVLRVRGAGGWSIRCASCEDISLLYLVDE